MNTKFKIVLLFCVCLMAQQATAQRYGKNYPDFEHKKWHFGAHLGGLNTRYRYELKPNFSQFDSIFQININQGPGFSIQLPVISWNVHSTFHLRLIPSLTFHETEFSYDFMRNGEKRTAAVRTQPTLLNFPILIKANTKRINNFAAYAVTGLSYSFDLASQEDVEQSTTDPIIKLKKHDFAYHVGGGFDFYLPYFKFGLEIKVSNGMRNVLIQDETFFTRPLQSLKSQVWWFTVTFEG